MSTSLAVHSSSSLTRLFDSLVRLVPSAYVLDEFSRWRRGKREIFLRHGTNTRCRLHSSRYSDGSNRASVKRAFKVHLRMDKKSSRFSLSFSFSSFLFFSFSLALAKARKLSCSQTNNKCTQRMTFKCNYSLMFLARAPRPPQKINPQSRWRS